MKALWIASLVAAIVLPCGAAPVVQNNSFEGDITVGTTTRQVVDGDLLYPPGYGPLTGVSGWTFSASGGDSYAGLLGNFAFSTENGCAVGNRIASQGGTPEEQAENAMAFLECTGSFWQSIPRFED